MKFKLKIDDKVIMDTDTSVIKDKEELIWYDDIQFLVIKVSGNEEKSMEITLRSL